MLLRHRGVSGLIVEPRHSDGVRLTIIAPLKLSNVRYQFKAVGEDNHFKENFLLPGDLAAFDGCHEVHRCSIDPTQPFESIVWLIFFDGAFKQ